MTRDEAESLEHGTVVYFFNGANGHVRVGLSDTAAGGTFWIDLIEPKDYRMVSSEYIKPTPVSEFQTEQEWHPLPKGWSWDTKLFNITSDRPQTEADQLNHLKMTNKADIEKALAAGMIVRAKENYHGDIEAQIDKNKGWRVWKGSNSWTLHYGEPNPYYDTVPYSNVFLTFDEAARRWRELNENLRQERAMSDRDWSIREIDRVLKRFPLEESGRLKKVVMSIPDIEDVEVRKRNEQLEWRYFSKQTAWQLVERTGQ